MATSDKILEVKNITKIYKTYKNNLDRLKEAFSNKIYHKKFIANKDISFSLYKGETLGIIGANGAGKSTILKIIAGVIEPTSGEVIRHGKVTALLELGTGFNEQMTGRENIFLNGTLVGMSQKECEQNLQDIIDFSELGEYIDEPILTYSSGMRMRLAFSIAIFSKPQILIVDEALSVGDAHFSAKCTNALKQKKEENLSVIYVSHDLNSLKILCDRVILLDKGSILEQGDPENVINTYNFLISKLNDDSLTYATKDKKTNSFGLFNIEIKKVAIKGVKSQTNIITSGEKAKITLFITSKENEQNMTIGIMIRDKFGQDIFGTNTFYHNIKVDFEAGKSYLCEFDMKLDLGIGKYSITAAVHKDKFHLDYCSHWIDKAEDFEIISDKDYNFAGICRLYPTITLKQMETK